MKRIILVIVLCCLMILGVILCGIGGNEFSVGKKSDVEVVDGEISLSIKKETLTNAGVTLVLKNNSKRSVIYGEPYEIEIKQDGSWHKINVELFFNLPAYTLKAGESKEIKLNWENSYGMLSAGEYRIIKSLSFETDSDISNNFYVAEEFVI